MSNYWNEKPKVKTFHAISDCQPREGVLDAMLSWGVARGFTSEPEVSDDGKWLKVKWTEVWSEEAKAYQIARKQGGFQWLTIH